MKNIRTDSSIHQRLKLLRSAMKQEDVEAVLVTSSDPHMSEYPAAHWRSREWLSGFTGSAGTMVITADFAGLWTDSRYWSQAEVELAGSGISLMRANDGATPTYTDWLKRSMHSGQIVATDGMTLSWLQARQIDSSLSEKKIALRTDIDILRTVWTDRPALPQAPIYSHDRHYATTDRSSKLEMLRNALREQGAQWHFISTLDDIAWLYNLRGSDCNFNPVFMAHALVGQQKAVLFVDREKVPADLREALAADGVELMPYEEATLSLAGLGSDEALLLDPRRVSHAIWRSVPPDVKIVEAINPTTLSKARKNTSELAHVRTFMEYDGAMLCKFFAWLEWALAEGRVVTELDVADKILGLRQHLPGYVSPSFDTIAGFNANGALPHYRATSERHARVEGNGLLLIDTGGQYLGGTTDITRTVPVGKPGEDQKRDFTMVLKGLIALSRVHFPRGTRAPMLDSIARAPLWEQGLDYGHGTGHGVGYFLNVHEGPHSISINAMPEPHTAMEEGMITSVEPGVYRPGRWGVRIENLVAACPVGKTEFGDFLRFETLTLCPIDTRCMELSLMSSDEIAWINDYHAQVRARLQFLVQGKAKEWLRERTEPV